MTLHHHKVSKKAKGFIGHKISKIMHEGVRGKKVDPKQAIAIALSMARKRGLKIKKKK